MWGGGEKGTRGKRTRLCRSGEIISEKEEGQRREGKEKKENGGRTRFGSAPLQVTK